MKLPKYLFNENEMSLDGLISVSQLQTYLSCKKKWEYNYVERIKPRVERAYLSVGKLCHKGMQIAMRTIMEYPDATVDQLVGPSVAAMKEDYDNYINETPLLDEEVPEFEQMWRTAESVFVQALKEFEPWRYEVIKLGEKPALELHFRVPCPPMKGLHGYIDAILKDKETGSIWCVDYKFRKSLAPDDDEAYNIQNAVYTYACTKMGIPITGTMTWQHLNTPPADPQILKDGKISRAKIKTTWEHYAKFCEEHGQNPEDYYMEMEDKLREIEWYRATYEYRNAETVDRIWQECVVPSAKDVKKSMNGRTNNYRSLYPWNCKMCQYQSLCQAELRGYDAQAIRDREYVIRSREVEDREQDESDKNIID